MLFRSLAWLMPLGLFLYALALTHSRGGFLAFLVALVVFLRYRFSTGKMLLLAGVMLPLVLYFFAGRQTSFDAASAGTGQTRIQLWSDGLYHLRTSPLFGVGTHEFHKLAGQEAHNSFVHSYAEMGLFGGTLFLGAFFYALWSLRRMSAGGRTVVEPELRRLLDRKSVV